MTVKPKTPARKRKRIGELLVDAEVITPLQLDEGLAVQKEEGGKLVQVLLNLGYVDVNVIAKFLASQPGIASIELSQYQVRPELCDLISREFAIENEVLAIDKLGKLLTVGMAFPLDSDTIAELEMMTGLKVKALLCSSEEIKSAIKQYYVEETPAKATDHKKDAEQIKTTAKLESVAHIVREIDSLPTLPQTVHRVKEAAQDPEKPLKDIATLVALDPAISAKLLQLANSSAYGFSNKIDNVHMATTLLGLAETCMVVTSSAIIDLTEKSGNFDHVHFWRECMFCASAAKRIAAAADMKNATGIFTAGLLCDIGRFALAEAAPTRHGKIDSKLFGKDLCAAENEVFGLAHPETGFTLVEHWNLPPEISVPIRFHHSPELATEQLDQVAVVALASQMTEMTLRGDEVNEEAFEASKELLDTTGLQVEQAIEILAALRQTK